jgi:hypothetical protein
MKHRIPWTLRLEIAAAALRGKVISLSYWNGRYTVELPPSAVRRWLKRRDDRKKGRVN